MCLARTERGLRHIFIIEKRAGLTLKTSALFCPTQASANRFVEVFFFRCVPAFQRKKRHSTMLCYPVEFQTIFSPSCELPSSQGEKTGGGDKEHPPPDPSPLTAFFSSHQLTVGVKQKNGSFPPPLAVLFATANAVCPLQVWRTLPSPFVRSWRGQTTARQVCRYRKKGGPLK